MPPKHKLTRGRLWRWTAWLALANAAALVLLSLRYFAFATPPQEALGWVFLALMVPAHFALLSFLLFPVAALPPLLVPGRWGFGWGVLVYTLGMAVMVVDTQVFSLYRFHLNGMVWNILVSGVADEILPFSAATFATAGAIVAVLLAGESALGWALWRVVRARRTLCGGRVALALVALLVAGHTMHAWADATLYSPITRQMHYLPFVRGATAKRFLEGYGFVPDAQAAARTVPHGTGGLEYPLRPLACTPRGSLPNIVFIAVDGFRGDALRPQATPNIQALADESLVFRNHFSAGNASRYGIFGLMYGLYGTYWKAMLAEQRGSAFIHQLNELGYRFAVYGSASLRHPEFDRTVFAELRERIDLDTQGGSPVARDRRITDKFLRFLERPGKAPFFGFLFYDSPHAFTHPPDYEGPFQPELEGDLNHLALDNDFDPVPFRNAYLNSVHFVDGLVGRVLDAMRERGLLENTIIVVTGDHGEEFNDNRLNYWGHNSNFSPPQTHVPLVLHWPGRGARAYTHTTSHVDVVPTLMRGALGCDAPLDVYSNGRSLFDTSPRPYVVAANYIGIALIEPERITEMDYYGRVHIVDRRYRELPDARLPAAHLQQVMEDMARFYGR